VSDFIKALEEPILEFNKILKFEIKSKTVGNSLSVRILILSAKLQIDTFHEERRKFNDKTIAGANNDYQRVLYYHVSLFLVF